MAQKLNLKPNVDGLSEGEGWAIVPVDEQFGEVRPHEDLLLVFRKSDAAEKRWVVDELLDGVACATLLKDPEFAIPAGKH